MTSDVSYAELHLPVFKQGDDLAVHLEEDVSPAEAMVNYAGQLRSAASILENVAARIREQPVQVEASCHYIGIAGPTDLIESMIDDELLEELEDEDMDDLNNDGDDFPDLEPDEGEEEDEEAE